LHQEHKSAAGREVTTSVDDFSRNFFFEGFANRSWLLESLLLLLLLLSFGISLERVGVWDEVGVLAGPAGAFVVWSTLIVEELGVVTYAIQNVHVPVYIFGLVLQRVT
jgi:hypothetical protein